jgi:hypothetical protein
MRKIHAAYNFRNGLPHQPNNIEVRQENTSEYEVLFTPRHLAFRNSQTPLKASELLITPRFSDFPQSSLFNYKYIFRRKEFENHSLLAAELHDCTEIPIF